MSFEPILVQTSFSSAPVPERSRAVPISWLLTAWFYLSVGEYTKREGEEIHCQWHRRHWQGWRDAAWSVSVQRPCLGLNFPLLFLGSVHSGGGWKLMPLAQDLSRCAPPVPDLIVLVEQRGMLARDIFFTPMPDRSLKAHVLARRPGRSKPERPLSCQL